MNGKLCPTINTGLIFAASQLVGRSVGERGVLRSVVGPVPAQSGSICRPLFFYALFAALSSRNRRLLSSRTIFVRFLPHIFGTEERGGGGSNSSDIVSQRLFWLSVDKKNLPPLQFFNRGWGSSTVLRTPMAARFDYTTEMTAFTSSQFSCRPHLCSLNSPTM